MQASSLEDVIDQGHWKRALFGTYALSLTFFESILLRALRKAECREVTIVTDANGYQQSLMERRSRAIGQEYRLIPVSLPKGIFHPKFCYLEGAISDCLAIGSGNLTFGGFGRNLEVLDVLDSDANGGCFTGFADFLDALSARSDFQCPDRSWLVDFSDRARTFKSAELDSQRARLIHSTKSSILSQATDFIGGSDGGTRMTILSPFHDKDGAAVRKLGEATRASKIRVALSPASNSSPFPFSATNHWSAQVLAVRVKDLDDKRSLHAKWIEWETSSGLHTLTGSINATSQALVTNNNIELGVLRFDASGKGWTKWATTPAPSEVDATVLEAGDTSTGLIYAEIDGTGEIHGSLLSHGAVDGDWSAEVQLSDGSLVDFTVSVSISGAFRQRVQDLADFAFKSGLQIEMKLGEKKARGWVQSAELLRMRGPIRMNLAAFLRVINRESTEDDDIALLEYFALHASQHFETFQGRIAMSKQESPKKDESAITISIDAIAPSVDGGVSSNQEGNARSLTSEWAINRIFSELRRRLLGNSFTSNTAAGNSTETEEADDDDPKDDDKPPTPRLDGALEQFEDKLRGLIDAPALQESARQGLLVLWFEVKLDMLIRRLNDKAGVTAFLNHWCTTVLGYVRDPVMTGALEQHFVTSICVLASIPEAHSDLRVLHEQLEFFYSGDVDISRARASLLANDRLSFGGMMADFQALTIEDALAAVLSKPTLRQEMHAIMTAFKMSQTLPDTPLWNVDIGKSLRGELQTGRKPRVNTIGSRDDTWGPGIG